MSKFVAEPGELVPVDEVGSPRTPGQLFMDLGVYCDSDAARREALVGWLGENEPIPILRVGLEYAGLIDADGRPLDAAQGRAAVAARDRRAAPQQRVG
jgi:hypothetical protein